MGDCDDADVPTRRGDSLRPRPSFCRRVAYSDYENTGCNFTSRGVAAASGRCKPPQPWVLEDNLEAPFAWSCRLVFTQQPTSGARVKLWPPHVAFEPPLNPIARVPSENACRRPILSRTSRTCHPQNAQSRNFFAIWRGRESDGRHGNAANGSSEGANVTIIGGSVTNQPRDLAKTEYCTGRLSVRPIG
jgi:hypothetical protein